jgi:hypothetical protein
MMNLFNIQYTLGGVTAVIQVEAKTYESAVKKLDKFIKAIKKTTVVVNINMIERE